MIHTHMSRAHFFGVMLRLASGLPCVATAHSRHVQLHWRFNDLVIAVSEATRRYHQRWNRVTAERIVTIPNSVNRQRLETAAAPQRARVRAELGLDDSWILLGTIGSVIPRKGILYLVRALPQVLAAAPRTRLAIINEGGFKGYTAKVRATIRRLGLENHVLWLGPGNHVPRLLPALDLYVLPSLEESLPMAVLEAMATGLPVVATSVGGVPECILPGETGVLVPPADCAALGGAVVRLLKDPAERRRLGNAAQCDIRKRFSPDGQTGQIETALAGAMARFKASHPCARYHDSHARSDAGIRLDAEPHGLSPRVPGDGNEAARGQAHLSASARGRSATIKLAKNEPVPGGL